MVYNGAQQCIIVYNSELMYLDFLLESDVSRLQMYSTNILFGVPDQGQMLDV